MPLQPPLPPSLASTSAASLLGDTAGNRAAPSSSSLSATIRVQHRPVKPSAFRYSEPAEEPIVKQETSGVAPPLPPSPIQIHSPPRPHLATRNQHPNSPEKSPSKYDLKGKGKETVHDDQDLPTKSLLRSLHGPSAGKAGLIRDPEETRQIIYEASKGSKYFQAQQQRDLDLTVRVDKLVAYLDKLVKERHNRLQAEEDRVDEMLKEMEKERVLTETVAVVDADAFYASCHQREDPSLEGKPFGVGKGVLTTASYEARKYGCSSAMAGFVAKKLCPELIFVPLDFKLYVEASRTIMDVLRQYGETSPASLDEAYISLTDYCRREQVTPAVAAERMRAQVFAETRLTVSAGVSPNAMLSKVAADKNKPNGQWVIDPTKEAVMEFTASLPVRKIPGIGRVSERILQAVGIETVADVYRERGKLFLIRNQIGLTFLLRAYLGLGRTEIKQAERGSRKGISVERTFRAVSEVQGFYDRLKLISEGLAADCEKTEYSGRTLTLKLKTHTFQSISRSKTLGSAIYFSDAPTFYAEGKKMLDKEIAERKALVARGGVPKGGKEFSLRLIGLRLSNLRDEQLTKNKGGKLDGWAGGKTRDSAGKPVSVKKEEGFDLDALGDLDEDELSARLGESGEVDKDDDNGRDLLAELEDGLDNDDLLQGVKSEEDSHATAIKPPASSDPLWAELGPLDDEVLRSIEHESAGDDVDAKFYNSMDRPMEYKPFFTAGESLNSRKEREPPAPLKDRLTFEQRVKNSTAHAVTSMTDKSSDQARPLTSQNLSRSHSGESTAGRSNGGLLTCPVCSKSFVGSELALSAHVAAHFDEQDLTVEKSKKIKTEHSSSTSTRSVPPQRGPNKSKSRTKDNKPPSRSGRVDSFFRPAPM